MLCWGHDAASVNESTMKFSTIFHFGFFFTVYLGAILLSSLSIIAIKLFFSQSFDFLSFFFF